MWVRKLKTLQTLTKLVSTEVNFAWATVKQGKIDDTRYIVAPIHAIVLSMFKGLFDININVRNFQVANKHSCDPLFQTDHIL